MKLKKYILFKINKLNYEFRTLNEKDVNQDYLNGLDEQNKYIKNIPAKISFASQKKYVRETLDTKSDTLLGLIVNNNLVATAGVQLSFSEIFLNNINTQVNKLATVGIFIFNTNFRGMGLGKVLVWAATSLFYECTRTQWFGAGMEKNNLPSYKSFLSCGYQVVLNDGEYYKMIANISDLKKPESIKHIITQEHG